MNAKMAEAFMMGRFTSWMPFDAGGGSLFGYSTEGRVRRALQ